MKLSIIIVNYNVRYLLEQCLLSVFASNRNFDIEVIVVDNNSSDGSINYLRPKFPEVIFIENTDNPGFAKANNQAYKIAQGEYILLLNPDTLLGENILDRTCNFLDTHPGAGAVGVKMINSFGKFLPESKRGFPSPWTSFCKIFGLSKFFPKSRLFGRYHMKYLDENEVHEVDILTGAFMLIRREIIERIGLLDETFFMYGEDIDLSYRITKDGYKNYYLPDAIIHYKGESTKKDDIKYVKIFYQAMYIFFKKYYPHYSRFFSFCVTAGIYLRAAIAVVKRLFGKVIKIKKWEHGVVVLDHSVLSYEEIIRFMDEQPVKNTEYRIYSPLSGLIIGSHYAQKKTDHVS
ncbi:glycosyltransferase family 2 protein [Viscerimonas tarda]